MINNGMYSEQLFKGEELLKAEEAGHRRVRSQLQYAIVTTLQRLHEVLR